MSASPQDTVPTNANTPVNPTTTSPNASTNLQLSTLLTETYTENEALKKELNNARKRAEKAERLLQALTDAPSSSPSSESSTKRVILEYEERVQRAEIAREEAESRRRAVLDNWAQLDRWLQTVEVRSSDARESFGRIVRDGGGQLTLGSIGTPLMTALGTPSMAPPPPPTSQPPRRHATRTPMTPFPSLPPLPPLPPTTSSTTSSSRRARTPSLESEYTHPPSKRSRGNGEPRMSYSDSVSTTKTNPFALLLRPLGSLSISIWSNMDTRPRRRLLLESSCPPAITINRTRTRTLLHIHICTRINTIPIMSIRVDPIQGLQVGLAALRWTLMRCSFALLQPTKSTASLPTPTNNHHHIWPVFLYQRRRQVKMVPRIYATTHDDTARMVAVVIADAYTSTRANKHKKERGMRIRLISLSRGRRYRRAWDCSNSRGEEEDSNRVHWFSRVRFSSIRPMCLRRSLRVHR